MGRELDLGDPVAVLLAVRRALQTAGQETAVYGGLALAAYGTPRETRDADLAVVGTSASEAREALRDAGIEATIAFDRTVFGGNLVARLTLLGPSASPAVNTADLVEPRSGRYARVALDRALEGELRGDPIRVLSPEDFILFKVLSTRERDLEDAASVLRSLADRLDLELVEREAGALDREIGDHDVEGRWEQVKGRIGKP